VLVGGVLPGESILYTLGAKSQGVLRGQLVRLETRSPVRVPSLCSAYGDCGGCDLMHASYQAQKEFKKQIVRESFIRLAHFDPGEPPLRDGPAWGYRTRIQLHKNERGQVGFKARASERIVSVMGCPVTQEGLQELFDPPKGSPAQEALLKLRPGRWNAVAVENSWRLEGQDDQATVEVKNKRMVLSLSGFFQSNLIVLEALIDYVLDSFPEGGEEVFDLFCGSGLFGAFLAERFTRVIGVEENEQALRLAKVNVQGPLNEFYASRLEDWLERHPKSLTHSPGTAVVVDPPRSGLSPRVKDFLVQHPPRRLVYVSCNPDTLARDAGFLKSKGFVPRDLTLFDFYPQTSHVEAALRLDHES
jgi:23S rRNA (uracil1939-C5)-methyltransferase